MGQLNKSDVVQRESHIGKIKFKILYTLATFVIKKKIVMVVGTAIESANSYHSKSV